MQAYGKFEGVPLNSALFGLGSFNDLCEGRFSFTDFSW